MSESGGVESASPVLAGVLYAAAGSDPQALVEVAREFSPRIERCGPREVTLDLSGLARLFGDAKAIAQELRRTAADRGLHVRVAIAGTRTAARLLARHRAGAAVIAPGTESTVLSRLPLSLLADMLANGSNAPTEQNVPNAPNASNVSNVLLRWGLRTLGDLAALPPDAVMARLGRRGIEWQRLARGEDARPLVPAAPEERFEQSRDLEWPIEGLEPLSFVLGRLMEPLSAHLEQRDRGAAVLHVRLRLVTKETHERTLELPSPMRDARTLRTLALLDLESHPPAAAIDRVTVAVDPTAARVVQYSLLTRPLPTAEQLSTLMARLHALVGESRCGSPAVVDSWRPGDFAMKPFNPGIGGRGSGIGERGSGITNPRTHAPRPPIPDPGSPIAVLRRFRHPVPVRVQVEAGKPVDLSVDRRGVPGGRVSICAGPWRTSGAWWLDVPESRPPTNSRPPTDPRPPIPDPRSPPRASRRERWDCDEWDVSLEDGTTYRLARARGRNQWFIEGMLD